MRTLDLRRCLKGITRRRSFVVFCFVCWCLCAADPHFPKAGLLKGLHNLDTCDPYMVPSLDQPETFVGGGAGEGIVSTVRDFPPAESSSSFLDTHLEGWRRLDCGNSPAALSLSDLPSGLAVLSLQVSHPTQKTQLSDQITLFPP